MKVRISIPGVLMACEDCGALVLGRKAVKHVELHARMVLFEDAIRALIHHSSMEEPVSRISHVVDFMEVEL